MTTAKQSDDDGTGYCRGCGTTLGEAHHNECDVSKRKPEIVRVFGRRVYRLRNDRRWSQEALAAAADLHRNYVGKIERGEVAPGLENISRLSDAFGITASELFEGI